MWSLKLFLILGCILHTHTVLSIWTCTQNSECSFMEGGVCTGGTCVCPGGQELVLGGTACAFPSPYFTSPCIDDHQCSALLTGFQCRRDEGQRVGQCDCQPGHHYFVGRCWKSIPAGGTCTRNEECFGELRDPYNLVCVDQTCVCAPGYYLRQRGECRKIGAVVGDGCIIDEDCLFPNGECNPRTFTCVVAGSASVQQTLTPAVRTNNVTTRAVTSRQGTVCDSTNPCGAPFQCSTYGICVCPRGYYASADGSRCLAELGSPVTQADQCAGFLAEVVDGRCGCAPNVYFHANMRDCVKATRRLSDSCLTDQMCHTFGAATRCGEPRVDEFYFRSCECITEYSVWDENRNLCRLVAGIGDMCAEKSDCLAGGMEIDCVINEQGQGICTCPEGSSDVGGLCLTTGLSLGDECQATSECTETEHTVCEEGICSCSEGYIERDGECAPTIGSPCLLDSDCATQHTLCLNSTTTNTTTCQCFEQSFLEYSGACYPRIPHIQAGCSVTPQCTELLGSASTCVEGACLCNDDYQYRDDFCWPKVGLFGACSRYSECYLGDITDRVECRNSLCQCSFDYPYSEELRTCLDSSSSAVVSSFITIVIALFYVMF